MESENEIRFNEIDDDSNEPLLIMDHFFLEENDMVKCGYIVKVHNFYDFNITSVQIKQIITNSFILQCL